LAVSGTNWISLRCPNRVGKDGLDMESWPTSSWFQPNARPSLLLRRWDYLLHIADAVDRSRSALHPVSVEDQFQGRDRDGGVLSMVAVAIVLPDTFFAQPK
jgi:hypothetical protein